MYTFAIYAHNLVFFSRVNCCLEGEIAFVGRETSKKQTKLVIVWGGGGEFKT